MKPEERKRCRVLVTGAGSGVGQGIVKALRIAELPLTIIGADIAPMNAALYRTDEALIIPRVESEGSLTKIIELLCRHRVNVLMVGSEFELEFFSENRGSIEESTRTLVIAADIDTVRIAGDKWLTAEFLRERGIAYAQSALPTSLEGAVRLAADWGYPVVLKTRQGTSSRHVHIVKDRRMLEEVYSQTPMPMIQRVIEVPSSELGAEYTCSVFKTREGRVIGPFTARRTVRGGTSWHIEVAPFDKLNTHLLAIGSAMDFIGSLNVQLMLTPAGPVPFELNARFSGTTAIRANFGFNEPAMALKSYYYKEAIPEPVIRSGVAMRYHEEVFIDNVRADGLAPGNQIGHVNPWF